MMGRSWIQVLAFVGLEVATVALALPASAQIEADDTLGAERSRLTRDAILRRRADRAGTRADLIEGGAQRGGNLFHSFDQFNVNEGQSVYFDNPDGVNNILGRVTGADVSDILGTLGVDGNANLFLLNPNGILFGPNARLDVNGSFVGSTANAIQFGTQGFFSTADPTAPPLLTVDPSAFLFNQINPDARIVNQSVTLSGDDNRGGVAVGLEVPFGESLLLLGGDVVLEGGSGVNAFGGRVELGGLSSPGTVGLAATGNQFQLTFPDNATRADVTLRDGARVDVVANNGGDVAVNARNVDLLNGSNIFAGIGTQLGFAGAQAGDVEINASGILTLSDSSFIQSSVFGGAVGNSGDVRITSQSVNLLNGSGLGSAVAGQGKSGEVRVQAADTITIAGQNATGTGSGILSVVGELDGFVGSGEGGDIDLQARSLVMVDGAQIGTTNLFAIGDSDAGDIRINLTDSLLMQGDLTAIQAITTGDGDGGNIFVTAGNAVDLRSGARLLTNTTGTGNAGNVTVTAGNSVVFDGVSTDYDGDGSVDRSGINSSVLLGGANSRQAGAITINTGNLTISNEAGVLSNIEAGAVGEGQGITINANSMQLLNGAQVQSILRGFDTVANLDAAQGSAGDIRINLIGDFEANSLINDFNVSNGIRSEIFTSAGDGTTGDAGDIFLKARNVTLQNGSRIVSDTSGADNSGSVTITATGQALFDDTFPNPDGDDPFRSGIFSSINRNPNLAPGAVDNRTAGDVNVNAGSLILRRGGSIYANVEEGATGQGGDINITGGSVLIQDGSQIQSILRGEGEFAGARGRTGDATVILTGSFTADGEENNRFSGGILTSVGTGTEGNAGNITVQARSIELTNGARFVTETQGQGNAGSVTIGATDFIRFDSFGQERSGIASSVKPANGDPIGRRAGLIRIDTGNTGNFTISNGAGILTNVETGADGVGGNIDITGGSVLIQDGSQIQSILRGEGQDIPGARGRTGDVNVTLTGSFTADGEDSSGFSSGVLTSVETGTEGNAGNITVQARSIELTNGARFVTETQGQGNAGSVTIGATDFIRFDGANQERSGIASSVKPANGDPIGRRAGDVLVTRGNLIVSNRAGIFTNVEAGADGRGGDIVIDANNLSMLNSAFIQSLLRGADGETAGATGATGIVDINLTGNFVARGINPLEPNSNEITTSAGTGTRGNAGNISLDARSVRFFDGSRLVTETAGQGNAGAVRVTANGTILFDGVNADDPQGRTPSGISSSVFAVSGAQGNRRAGDIRINNGAVRLSNDATIFANVEVGAIGRGGDIIIDAESLTLLNSGQLQTFLRGAEELNGGAQGRPGTITLRLSKDFTARGVGESGRSNSLFTSAERNTDGDAGNIRVHARSVRLFDGSRLVTETRGQGNAGRVIVRAGRSILFDGINEDTQSGIASSVFAADNATGFRRAGDIQISTGNFEVINDAVIFSNVEEGAVGRSGDILINADSMALTGGGQIQSLLREDLSGNLAGARGRTGLVDIRLGQGTLLISGVGNRNNPSAIFTQVQPGTSGDAGRVEVRAGAINIENTGSINSSTLGEGDGGRLNLRGARSITLRNGGNIRTEATEQSSGQAGAVRLDTRQLRVEGAGSSVSATSQVTDGGNITINAEEVTIRDTIQATPTDDASQGGILASSESGRGGSITLRNLQTLEVENGEISASTRSGQAGTLIVDATEGSVELRNRGRLQVAASGKEGDAGDLEITTDRFLAENSSASVSSADGQAGNLTVDANAIQLENGRLTARTAETGANISLQNVEQLYMRDGSQISAPASESARGGNVTLDNADGFTVAVANEDSDIIANATEGQGGNINIDTLGIYNFRVGPDQPVTNDIDASSQFNRQGSVNINTPDTDPSRGLIELPSGVVDASQQIDRTCRARGTDQFGEFVITGRGGLPPNPNEVLDTDELDTESTATDWVTPDQDIDQPRSRSSTPSSLDASSDANSIVEAQGWVVGADGKVVLVAQASEPTNAPIPDSVRCP